MDEATSQSESRIEIWVRNCTHNGSKKAQKTVCDRVQTLKQKGKITEVATKTWGRQINAATADIMEEFVLPEREAINEFERWASQHGCTLHPWFDRRKTSSLIADETHDVIIPPVMCLAVYNDGGELQGVFPHSDGEEIHTVDDCLDRFGDENDAISKLRT